MVQEQTQALIEIAPDKDAEVAKLLTQAEALLKYAEARVIASPEDVKSATQDLSLIAVLKKALEAKRKEYVGPLNAFVKGFNDTFKVFFQPIEEADRLTRSKVMDYQAEEKRKAEEIEEINRLRMEAARKEASLNGTGEISESVDLIDPPAAPASTVRTAVGSTGTAMIKKWEVENFADVPDEYKMVDASKVGKVVRAGIPSIPGIRIYEEPILQVRPR